MASRKYMPKESEIQKAILDYLRLVCKIFCYKNNTTGIYKKSTNSYIPSQSVGCPDITAIINGKYIGIEVKRPGGKVSPEQLKFGEYIKEAGGEYWVVYSVEDCEEQIKKILEEKV
jgi:hypothetical protein